MTNKEKKNLYEGMYVVSTTLSDEARKKALERIETGITSRGGEVVKRHDMGKKRMAYEIAGHREGHYYLLYFQIAASAITEMWKEYHLNEDLIRFLTVRTDKVLEKLEFKPLVEVE